MVSVDKKQLLKRVDEALDDVRPHLAVDGGNVEVVDITDDFVVQIKWLGNCQACKMSSMTLKAGIEQTLKTQVPEVVGVVAINPFQS